MLSDAAVRKAKGREKDYKLTDSAGLHLYVTTTGHRSWRFKYRFGDKERRIVFGAYPEVSLAEAREKRDEARRLLRDNRDPAVEARKAKLVSAVRHQNSFEKIAREWHAKQQGRWKSVHASDVITSLERDVFPQLGPIPISDIDAPLVLAVLGPVEQRGSVETAHRLLQRISAVFRYAVGAGMATSNPAAEMKGNLLPVPPRVRWPALTDIDKIRALIATVDAANASPVTKLASRFMALTAQQPGMIRTAGWDEFEGINWDDPGADAADAIWRISAMKMKQVLELRADATFEHVVPLSTQAVDVLHIVRRLTGRCALAFTGHRDANAPMSENAVGYLYNREGFRGQHVPHGWRTSFSTVMNGMAERSHPGTDRLIIDRLIIDLMLAHTPTGLSESERDYNRAGYMDRRRELTQMWADLIMDGLQPAEALLAGPRRPLSRTR